MKKELRIVFMGTPEFAVASLDALLKAGHRVEGVVTAPDKPAGRGRKLSVSAVKAFAVSKQLKVLQPGKLKNPEFLGELKSLNADLFVVVAFRMLPREVWEMPSLGTFNLHASLLPQYRGAAPINHVLINGEKETGVTTFFINEQIDTGNILFQEKTAILPDETAGELHDRLMVMGAHLVVKTVNAIQNGDYSVIPQEELPVDGTLKTAPKIFKEDCRINWHRNVTDVYNFIRGLSPYPAAFGILKTANDEMVHVKFYKVRYETAAHRNLPGSIETNHKDFLAVWTGNGKIIVDELQIAGKKRLRVTDFLNGFKFQENAFFE